MALAFHCRIRGEPHPPQPRPIHPRCLLLWPPGRLRPPGPTQPRSRALIHLQHFREAQGHPLKPLPKGEMGGNPVPLRLLPLMGDDSNSPRPNPTDPGGYRQAPGYSDWWSGGLCHMGVACDFGAVRGFSMGSRFPCTAEWVPSRLDRADAIVL